MDDQPELPDVVDLLEARPALAGVVVRPHTARRIANHRAVQSGVPYVYLLRCRDGSLYAGAAMDLARRLAEHSAGRASRYTRSRLPVDLVWWSQVESWSAALREEIRVKGLNRASKDELIQAGAAATTRE